MLQYISYEDRLVISSLFLTHDNINLLQLEYSFISDYTLTK